MAKGDYFFNLNSKKNLTYPSPGVLTAVQLWSNIWERNLTYLSHNIYETKLLFPVWICKEILKFVLQVQQLTIDIDKEKREANHAADKLCEWEEKVKTCKKTQSIISQERDPEGELAHLRSEVHRMQVGDFRKICTRIDRKSREGVNYLTLLEKIY